MTFKTLIVFVFTFVAASIALAAKSKDFTSLGMPGPTLTPASIDGTFDDAQLAELAKNFKEEAKRRPSSGSGVASEDNMSDQYKTFRNALLQIRTGKQLSDLLKKYDANYDQLPPDLQYIVARMTPTLTLGGYIWKMLPVVKQVVISQETLLGLVRGAADQVMIHDGDSQAIAYVQFVGEPQAGDSQQFKTEGDVQAYFNNKIIPALIKAVTRLQKVSLARPVVMDNKIRFGDFGFNGGQESDRFKLIGEAERFAAIARIYRRLAFMSEFVSYNMNGHLALRKELGRAVGFDSILPSLESSVDLSLGSVEGLTRKSRTDIVRKSKYAALYTLLPNGRETMKQAYLFLHRNVVCLSRAWEALKNEPEDAYWGLDPVLFRERKTNIQMAIDNLNRLVPAPNANGQTDLRGVIDGETVTVNLKAYYYDNPPQDLKHLLPTAFDNHDELNWAKSKGIADFSDMTFKKDWVEVKVDGKKTEFRDYLYGRGIQWDTSDQGYGTIFPGLHDGRDVARAQKVLSETRGARVVANSLMAYIK